jgi:hypothetical protein
LQGLAAFFQILAQRLRIWAENLEVLSLALDEHYPGWRLLKAARA